MYKIVAFWSTPKPADIEAFEKYYWDVHVPKAEIVPGLRGIELMRIDAGLEGAAPPFYRVAELYFDSPEVMKQSSESAAWQAMRADAGLMIERFGVALTVGVGWEDKRSRSPRR